MKNYFIRKNDSFDIKLPNQLNGKVWTKKLIAKLLQLADESNQNWKEISKSLIIFCEDECKIKFEEIKNNQRKGSWTKDEDEQLKTLTADFNNVNWYECSILIGRNSLECRQRSAELMNPNIIGGWSHGEQISIFKFVRVFRFSWKKIIELLPGRNQNSVKSFFHSTIRRIKKSLLFKFLKVMVTWPTYTNKSKELNIKN